VPLIIHTVKADEIIDSRYERLLRRAKTEDLTEVSGIGCLYQSGVDRQGRPVVVFVGKWFTATKINLEKVKIFIKFFDQIHVINVHKSYERNTLSLL
jgi:hypothetical protein